MCLFCYSFFVLFDYYLFLVCHTYLSFPINTKQFDSYYIFYVHQLSSSSCCIPCIDLFFCGLFSLSCITPTLSLEVVQHATIAASLLDTGHGHGWCVIPQCIQCLMLFFLFGGEWLSCFFNVLLWLSYLFCSAHHVEFLVNCRLSSMAFLRPLAFCQLFSW